MQCELMLASSSPVRIVGFWSVGLGKENPKNLTDDEVSLETSGTVGPSFSITTQKNVIVSINAV
jgi:hypothetical protein